MNFSFKYGEKTYRKESFNKVGEDFVCELGNGVLVTAVSKDYKEFDACEWVLYFENKGNKNSEVFSDIKDCDITYACIKAEKKQDGVRASKNIPAITCMNGMVYQDFYRRSDEVSATEFGFYTEYFFDENVPKHYENVGGRSSDGTMPFFDFHTKDDGIMLAIGWTGDWALDAMRMDDDIHITTRLKKTNFYLMPGEKIRTTSVLIMEYHNEDHRNKFKRLLKKYFSHKTNHPEKPESLTSAMLWGSLTSEEMIRRIRQLKKHDIPIDTIWVDAGWYGKIVGTNTHGTEWGNNTGDWRFNPVLHPNEMEDVAKVCKEEGLGFLLWVEIERAIKGTPMTVEHPDWFFSVEGEDKNLVLNLGNQDAWNYAFDLIDGYVKKLHLSCYRQDYNVTIPSTSLYFKENDEKNREGITEIKHIMGLYGLWDTLLEKNPDLIIDNCASGGRRIDFETLRRSIPLFRTDYLCLNNTNFDILALHNIGATAYLPYQGGSTGDTRDIYNARCSYSSSWAIQNYFYAYNEMNEDDFAATKKVVEEYNRIKKYLSCDFYNHSIGVYDETNTTWTITQHHDPDTQSGVVMAFRKENSPFEVAKISLKGLQKNADYVFTNLNNEETYVTNSEIVLSLPEKRSSLILEYKLK